MYYVLGQCEKQVALSANSYPLLSFSSSPPFSNSDLGSFTFLLSFNSILNNSTFKMGTSSVIFSLNKSPL